VEEQPLFVGGRRHDHSNHPAGNRGLIQEQLHSGAFESVEDVLFDALEMQSEREAWFRENKEALNAKIERGLAQLDRGEGIPGDQLRARLEADRAADRRAWHLEIEPK
jgi:antitoxin ParD1/3/4